ncbi:anaerobic coproporphyrinogen III oxidase [Bacillus oleivorans]|uniref:Heme chaperone HemW n=1 Tax=Bacillus oleivorans TaxID=1448271 RepID=A0A285CLF7_9BACI|nr:radical SAM family heme chaperone HemW [Bacillus oleivorans]SNX67856.1 anaerobic coproporphyrinogen III oxidase [Bacillus oleivorans]
MVQSAYIHIPFCHQICHYCDFNKFFIQNQPVEDYVASLSREIDLTLENYPVQQPLKTIYVGGGTPTALNVSQLSQLLVTIERRLPLAESGEFTFEANPEDLTEEKLWLLKKHGVNRLSIGVQTFDDVVLEAIGRTHRTDEVLKGIELAKSIGFENMSIDLMYALPKQTLDSVKKSVNIALGLGIPHLSLYSLIVEPKTVFYNLMRKGKLKLPNQDTEADMYDYIIDALNRNRYIQYEISNFALEGYESKHNITYWDNEQYYGFGAGAHSYVAGIRRGNIGPLKKYMSYIKEGKLPVIEENKLSKLEQIEEQLFLGLRKTAGVNLAQFEQKFGEKLESIYDRQIRDLAEKELVELTDDFIRLTKKGRFLGNEVFQAFILD